MNPVIGDTPEQLGSCTTADTMMIGDKIVTKQDYLALAAQVAVMRDTGNEVYEELQQWALTESHEETGRVSSAWRKARTQTPQQALAEIRAEAIESLLPKCVFSDDHKVKIITESMIKNHAANARKGGAK